MFPDDMGRVPMPPTPTGFKIWFAVCAVMGIAFTIFIVWFLLQLLDKL